MLLTAALADARLASRVAALIDDLEEPAAELDSLSSLPRAVLVLLPVEVVELVRLPGVVVAGAVAAGVVAVFVGVVFVGVFGGVVLVGEVLVGVMLAAEALAPPDPLEPPVLVPSPLVSCSLARLASAD